MAKKKEFDLIENPEAAVEAGLNKVETFVQKHKEKIITVVAAAVVGVAGIWAYNQFISIPNEEKAQVAIYPAQQAFAKDSLKLALNGNGLTLGFLDIIDEYGATKAANLANYYAGLCYLSLGQPEDAIEYLDNFKIKIKLIGKFTTERGRINCSLRESDGSWRWLGMQFVVAEL